jgi:hypothetical protein
MPHQTPYDEDYPACARTYATLRIYHEDLDTDSLTLLLGVEPTHAQVKGLPCTHPTGRTFTPVLGGWFLSTKGEVSSKDVRHHLDWILSQLAGCDGALRSLQDPGYRMDMFCYWRSGRGHGGPVLSPDLMRRFGELEIEAGFDVYG